MKKILIIEDEVETRNVFLECLEAEGFDAMTAENGRVGLFLAQQHLPDLVICDIMMPDVDGYGVLTTLRQDPVTAVIPFIFVTAKTTEAERQYGMKLGANYYLIKPFTTDDLLKAITKVWN